MHEHFEVWISPGMEIETAVAAALEPHRETYNEGTDTISGIWDWYQIGGRWTGVKDSAYDPCKDSKNIEDCRLCNKSGYRSDGVGLSMRAKDPSYTCNSCGEFDHKNKIWTHGKFGPGKTLKWPTEWTKFDGDIVSVNNISDKLTCSTLIVGATAYQTSEWNGENFIDTDFDGVVTAKLKKLGITDGLIVTVDCHC